MRPASRGQEGAQTPARGNLPRPHSLSYTLLILKIKAVQDDQLNMAVFF